jgi:hypothetical protein
MVIGGSGWLQPDLQLMQTDVFSATADVKQVQQLSTLPTCHQPPPPWSHLQLGVGHAVSHGPEPTIGSQRALGGHWVEAQAHTPGDVRALTKPPPLCPLSLAFGFMAQARPGLSLDLHTWTRTHGQESKANL